MNINFNQVVSFDDEIRLSMECIRAGIKYFSNSGYTTITYFLPLLLLSAGYERILKLLFIFNEIQNNKKPPDNKRLRSLDHGISSILNEVINIAEKSNIYKQIPDRINDINFLKDNCLQKFIKILSEFAKDTRYFNLNTITEAKLQHSKPEELLSFFREYIIESNPEIKNKITNENFDTKILYQEINKFIVELLQKFTRVICFFFTQGAFGIEARQYSAGLLEPFLSLKDTELSIIKY